MTPDKLKMLVDDAVKQLKAAKTPDEIKAAKTKLKCTQLVVNAYLFYGDAMEKLS